MHQQMAILNMVGDIRLRLTEGISMTLQLTTTAMKDIQGLGPPGGSVEEMEDGIAQKK